MSKVSKADLDFFAYQWSVEEEQESTIIRVYGITKDNKNVYVRIDNFTPYCYVELPTDIEWNNSRIEMVVNKLSSLNRKMYQPVKKDFVMRRKLYYAWKEKRDIDKPGKLLYKDKLFPFLFFAFRSTEALEKFNYAMKREIDINGIGRIKFNIHEYNKRVSPIVKMLALKKLPAAGWINVKGIKIPETDKESSFDIEIACSYENLKPIDDTSIPIPRVLSFDIEANSTITSAMPNASRPNDKIFQIGCVSSINGVKKKYLFSLGKPDKNIVGDDTILKLYKTEADLIVSLRDFIRQEEFNIILGYNILSWDFLYMIDRAKFTKCLSEFDTMGCLNGIHDKLVAPVFESKAYNAQKLTYLDSEGRLYLDLLPIIKREHKLKNYRLKTVLSHFDLPNKDPLSAKDIFRCYREFSSSSLGKVGKYCVQDANVTLLLYEKLQTWFGMCEMAKTAHVPIFWLFTEGTQIQMYSQVMEYCMYNNYVVMSTGYKLKEGEEEYVGATVLKPIPGKYKKVISFDFASLYPSIMMGYNIDYSTLIPEPENYAIGMYNTKEYLAEWKKFPCFVKLNDHENNIQIWDEVHNKTELKNKVEEVRKKYPKRIIFIQNEKSNIEDKDCHVFEWEDHSNCEHDMDRKRKKNGEFSTAKAKVICGQRYYRFIKPEVGGKGVVPILLESLISRRKLTRADIVKNEKEIRTLLVYILKHAKKETSHFIDSFKSRNKKYFENIEDEVNSLKLDDSFDTSKIKDITDRISFLETTNSILDKRQASYKICANSMYGAMGVKRGQLPLVPGASSVTFKGRSLIEFISTHIPEKYGGVTVYGDTDSSMIYFPHIKNNKDAVDLAEKITKDMEQYFQKPVKLEFEKVYEKYIILTKKRYMAYVANKKGEIIDFINKGVVLTRRENCTFLRDIYYKTATSILDDVDDKTILSDIIDCINTLFERKYSFRNFVITKSLSRSEYNTKTLPAHAQLARKMKERGIPVDTGSRIEYIFTTKCQGMKKFNQGEKVEDLDYFAQWRQYLRVDYLYYMEKQLIKPLDELLKVGLGIENFVKKQYELRLAKWKVTERIRELFSSNIVVEGEPEEVQKPKRVVKKPVVKKEVVKKPVVKKTPLKQHMKKKSPKIVFEDDEESSEIESVLEEQIYHDRASEIESVLEEQMYNRDREKDMWEKYNKDINTIKKPINVY